MIFQAVMFKGLAKEELVSESLFAANSGKQ
jgi:hypothetical protein